MEGGGGATLPTTTTFLPILDDLLSPDFRPVTHPPVITPLQTPTTVQSVTHNGVLPPEGKGNEEAAVKIQKWWKSSSSKRVSLDLGDVKEERAKHSIRHRRAEEHIRALESEVTRLKSSLATERKLRSLQYEAIRSLWAQVQKLSVNNADQPSSVMSQSLPNGLPLSAPAPPNVCNCAQSMSGVVQRLESEIQELRSLITQNLASKEEGASKEDADSSSGSSAKSQNKRPQSLDLNGGGGKVSVSAKPEELQGYANEMAKFVVERGISDNVAEGDAK